MGLPLNLYGFTIQSVWVYHTICMGLPYNLYGFTIQSVWVYHTICKGLPYNLYGFTIQSVWVYHTIRMGLPYNMYGFTIQSVWVYHTICMVIELKRFVVILHTVLHQFLIRCYSRTVYVMKLKTKNYKLEFKVLLRSFNVIIF